MIWGKRDLFLPYRYAFTQREIFPEASIHLLNRSGHFPYADDPEAVADLLLPFLRAQTAAASAAAADCASAPGPAGDGEA